MGLPEGGLGEAAREEGVRALPALFNFYTLLICKEPLRRNHHPSGCGFTHSQAFSYFFSGVTVQMEFESCPLGFGDLG